MVVSRSDHGWAALKDFATAQQAEVAFVKQDVTQTTAPAAIVAAPQAAFGRIDILVNNAGIQ